MRLRSLPQLLLTTVVVWLASSASAHADDQRAAVIPVQLLGPFAARAELRQQLTSDLAAHVRAAGVHVLPDDVLAPIDNECHDQECLLQILDAYGVQVAVAARLTKSDDKNYQLHLLVLLHPVFAGGAAATVQLRDKACANCSEHDATDQLTALLDELLAAQHPAAPPSSAPTPAPVVAPPRASPPLPPLDKRRLAIRISALIDGVGGLTFLALGFSELAHDHDVLSRSVQPCGANMCLHTSLLATRDGQIGDFTVGAVLTAGAVALAAWGFWPQRRPTSTANAFLDRLRVTPAVGSRGGQLLFELRL